MIQRHPNHTFTVGTMPAIQRPGVPRHEPNSLLLLQCACDFERIEDMHSLLVVLGFVHSQMRIRKQPSKSIFNRASSDPAGCFDLAYAM